MTLSTHTTRDKRKGFGKSTSRNRVYSQRVNTENDRQESGRDWSRKKDIQRSMVWQRRKSDESIRELGDKKNIQVGR